MIPLYAYMMITIILLGSGLFVMITRRHIIAILIGIELILHGVNLNLVALNQSSLLQENEPTGGLILGLFIILLAGARIAVALALCFAVYRNFQSADVKHFMTLKG
jgi:NADH-quinone oxidoreductase subunit K